MTVFTSGKWRLEVDRMVDNQPVDFRVSYDGVPIDAKGGLKVRVWRDQVEVDPVDGVRCFKMADPQRWSFTFEGVGLAREILPDAEEV